MQSDPTQGSGDGYLSRPKAQAAAGLIEKGKGAINGTYSWS